MRRNSLVLKFCCAGLLLGSSVLISPLQAQQRESLDLLFYPRATQQKVLSYGEQKRVYVQYSEDSVQEVLLHYLALTQQPQWRLDFPTGEAARAWIAALDAEQEPVFMLSLYNLKSKLNFNLTLGPVSSTSSQRLRSIITLYSTGRPFGRQRG